MIGKLLFKDVSLFAIKKIHKLCLVEKRTDELPYKMNLDEEKLRALFFGDFQADE